MLEDQQLMVIGIGRHEDRNGSIGARPSAKLRIVHKGDLPRHLGKVSFHQTLTRCTPAVATRQHIIRLLLL